VAEQFYLDTISLGCCMGWLLWWRILVSVMIPY
jgi:hypothetical protein